MGGSEALRAEGMDADELKRNSASTTPLIGAFFVPLFFLEFISQLTTARTCRMWKDRVYIWGNYII